ncbi:hypothetical protein C2E20_2793 [Micractinium conductrix]|uniref:Uncharacterized protein n=1 Tax=Micractinium conductrix TaxID=554055 RepID=A0A2P6VJA7_9CHLO|nr:hypothetical protein C2E20_2793 [Micractinium conductrix]|eukprot:PSC74147.1 hypothetical protein C2E20_2793 [Micractinium conductrix]
MAVHVAYARALETAGWLEFRGKLFPLCAGMAAKSGLLDSGLRQSGLREGPGARPVLALDSSQIQSLALALGHVPSPLSLERFLASLSGAALEMSCSEVEQVVQLLKLADWFDAHELRDRCDKRLCQLLTGLSNRQQVSDSREEAAAMALEAGLQHYLTKTVAWLLPWALQQLSHGNKACSGAASEQLSGELQSQQHSAWLHDRRARRRRRLHSALMADDQLKVIVMEQQWWAQGDEYEACSGCAACGATPAALRPAFDISGDAWLWSRDGSAYHAAAAHFAHLLAERCWGLTPAGFTAYGSGGLAPMKAVAQRAPEAGGGWGDAGLQRQGSFSSQPSAELNHNANMATPLCQRATPSCTSSSSGSSARRASHSSGGRLPALARPAAAPLRRRRQQRRVAASTVIEEDLWQYPDREQWYQAKWCATDQPDWNPARFVRSTQLAPGVREVVVECQVSREKVPLRNAYKHIGQRASLRVNSGAVAEVAPAAPPFPESLNREALLRVRGDIKADETKKVIEEISVLAELPLYVREAEAPEIYKLTAEDGIEVGPFVGGGLPLRGLVSAVYRFPTVVMFCEGAGIAAARALIEAGTQPAGLSLKRRTDVRMYYRAPNEACLCYRDLHEEWAEKWGVQVITSTRDSFSDMFDDDQTLMYDPDTTAAVILCGADEEAEAAALEVCREAEITVVVKQSEEAQPTEYLKYGKPRDE